MQTSSWSSVSPKNYRSLLWPDRNLKPVASCRSHDSHAAENKSRRVAYSAQLTVNLSASCCAYEVQKDSRKYQEDIFGIEKKTSRESNVNTM